MHDGVVPEGAGGPRTVEDAAERLQLGVCHAGPWLDDVRAEVIPAGAAALKVEQQLVCASRHHLEGILREGAEEAAGAAARVDHCDLVNAHISQVAFLRLANPARWVTSRRVLQLPHRRCVDKQPSRTICRGAAPRAGRRWLGGRGGAASSCAVQAASGRRQAGSQNGGSYHPAFQGPDYWSRKPPEASPAWRHRVKRVPSQLEP
mmetsp:Transcript_165850/g.403028  ORF Transcript_165850/g.403028 Transcript_165850/m.403028 type:complete len:205 (-) Transcript_165850:23-637(-)